MIDLIDKDFESIAVDRKHAIRKANNHVHASTITLTVMPAHTHAYPHKCVLCVH